MGARYEMDYLLLVLSASINGTKSVFAKIGNKYIDESQNIYTYNFYMFLTALITSLAVGLPAFNGLSLTTALIGFFYGVFLYFGQFFLIKAINEGSTSISTLFYSCGFLGPTIFSVFAYDESISSFQIFGIALILLSFFITVDGKQKTTGKWFVYVFSALLCNAATSISQKIFAMSEFKSQQSGFMIVLFLTGTVIALLFAQKKLTLPSPPFLRTSFCSGLALGSLNMLNVFLAKILPGSIVFPCVNSGGIVFSAILAGIVLKEKLSIKKIIGIAIGIVAIFIIALL